MASAGIDIVDEASGEHHPFISCDDPPAGTRWSAGTLAGTATVAIGAIVTLHVVVPARLLTILQTAGGVFLGACLFKYRDRVNVLEAHLSKAKDAVSRLHDALEETQDSLASRKAELEAAKKRELAAI